MKYILNQQLKRLFAIAVMVGTTAWMLYHIQTTTQFDWDMTTIVDIVGILAIIVTTAKIRIASAHVEHYHQEMNHHAR
jgi:hypothetical protein